MAAKRHHPIVSNTLTNFRELLENEYIGGWDLKRGGQFADFTLTIASVEAFRPKQRKRVKRDDGSFGAERVRRFVIKFVEAEKPWLAGPASGEIIRGLYGPPSNWPGKLLTLYYETEIYFGRTKVGGVRPRPDVPKRAADADMPSQPVDPEMAAVKAEAAAREPGED